MTDRKEFKTYTEKLLNDVDLEESKLVKETKQKHPNAVTMNEYEQYPSSKAHRSKFFKLIWYGQHRDHYNFKSMLNNLIQLLGKFDVNKIYNIPFDNNANDYGTILYHISKPNYQTDSDLQKQNSQCYMVSLLLELKANVNIHMETLMTPIYVATNIKLAQLLINAGADIYSTIFMQRTPLSILWGKLQISNKKYPKSHKTKIQEYLKELLHFYVMNGVKITLYKSQDQGILLNYLQDRNQFIFDELNVLVFNKLLSRDTMGIVRLYATETIRGHAGPLLTPC